MPTTRRELVLDAAIRLLGTKGPRGLTHRAVDAEAGLPPGSTSNGFRTRKALLAGVGERISELERATWERFAAEYRVGQRQPFAGALAKFAAAASRERTLTVARHAMFVEAEHDPELRGPLRAQRRELERWGAHWLASLGSSAPAEDFWAAMALLDGLLLHHCATASARTPIATEHAFATLLRGVR